MAPPRRRRRWSVAVAALVVPAAAFLSSGAGTTSPPMGASSVAGSAGAELVAVAAPLREVRSAGYAYSPEPGESVVLSASSASRSVRRVLPQGVAPETGLQVKTILAARAISAVFPEVTAIGGVRQDYLKWHPNGLAIDVMIPGWDTDQGEALGNEVVAYVLANKERFGLDHVIWRQIIWSKSRSAPHVMTHFGSADADHFTHVHVATEGGGYPTGLETYFG
ncbi:hypothetical protein GCM10023114_43660 [Mycolicibacterium sediminis]|uniref:ARB-07466-like C-terminal domain-containing protein n=2 Tax=Mycolicibacterium sediminis TaxID=1286180 RepID=A0A7I7QVG9_9MYCO|nr:hypothetical protein MSEDJ_41260 [Mycolicibacterium sediminis]